jgi:tRNA pseudouridine55 synthase
MMSNRVGEARPSGVLVVDKPRGPSSHDVVARVRRLLATREVGHAGTLDPMATGVLVVAVGEATKLAAYLTSQDKEYEATVSLGVATDTLDADGAETGRADVPPEVLSELSIGALGGPWIDRALAAEWARTEQIPPAFSAIQQGGERAYAKARRGEVPALMARAVGVRSLALVSGAAEPPSLTIRLAVTKGYYVRAFARDLATALGTLGHLTSLRRLRSGSFGAAEALVLDAPPASLISRLIPLAEAAARALPVLRLSADAATDARHGRAIALPSQTPEDRAPHAWLDADGRLVAVGQVDADGRAKVLRGFRDDGAFASPLPV